MSRILKREQAFQDLDSLAAYLGNSSEALAVRFLDAAQRTCALLAGSPRLGSRWETTRHELSGLRVSAVEGFPNHLIFYRPLEDGGGGIEVIRVLHAARNIEGILGGAGETGG